MDSLSRFFKRKSESEAMALMVLSPAFYFLSGIRGYSDSWLLPLGYMAATAMACRTITAGRSAKKAVEAAQLRGKTVVVTGANVGLGFYTALRLAEGGATVAISCRSEAVLKEAKRALMAAASRPIDIVAEQPMTLEDFDSVRAFGAWVARRFPSGVDVLVNNAGVAVMSGSHYSAKAGGKYELHTIINFLGPQLLSELLLPLLKKANGRVVNLSSEAHNVVKFKDYADVIIAGNRGESDSEGFVATSPGFHRYGCSKLLNIATSTWLNSQGVTSVAVHPGVVATNIFNKAMPRWAFMLFLAIGSLFLKSPNEGAQTQIYCAVCPKEELAALPDGRSRYFYDGKDQTHQMSAAAKNVPDALKVAEWARQELGMA